MSGTRPTQAYKIDLRSDCGLDPTCDAIGAFASHGAPFPPRPAPANRTAAMSPLRPLRYVPTRGSVRGLPAERAQHDETLGVCVVPAGRGLACGGLPGGPRG